MYTLDANVFACTLDPNEPEYATCRALLAQLAQPTSVPTLAFRRFWQLRGAAAGHVRWKGPVECI